MIEAIEVIKMALRLYIADVIGSGTEEDPWRPVVDEYPVNWWEASDGRPARSDMQVYAEVDNATHNRMVDDARIDFIAEA